MCVCVCGDGGCCGGGGGGGSVCWCTPFSLQMYKHIHTDRNHETYTNIMLPVQNPYDSLRILIEQIWAWAACPESIRFLKDSDWKVTRSEPDVFRSKPELQLYDFLRILRIQIGNSQIWVWAAAVQNQYDSLRNIIGKLPDLSLTSSDLSLSCSYTIS